MFEVFPKLQQAEHGLVKDSEGPVVRVRTDVVRQELPKE